MSPAPDWYRPLGRTGVKVSPLTLGTMNFGPRYHPDDDLARPRQGFGDRLAVQGSFDGTRIAENQSAHRHVLQDRGRIDGTAGAADDRKRAGNE